jgi:hypothetical protein
MRAINILRLCINWIVVASCGSLYFLTWIFANIGFSILKSIKQLFVEIFELFRDAWVRGLGSPKVLLTSKRKWLFTGELWFFEKPKKKPN